MTLRCNGGSCPSTRFPCSQGPPQFDENGALVVQKRVLQADAVCTVDAKFSRAVEIGRVVTSSLPGLVGSLTTVGSETVLGALSVEELPDGPFRSGLSVGSNTFCTIATDVEVLQLAPSTTGGTASGGSLIFWKGATTDAPDASAQGGRLDVIFDHPPGPGGFQTYSAPPSTYLARGAGVYYEAKNADAPSFNISGALTGMGLSTLTTFVTSLAGTGAITQTIQGGTGIFGRRSAAGYATWGNWVSVATWA